MTDEVRLAEQYIFTWPDGSQVLVTLWTDGSTTAAKREHRSDLWGIPADGEREERHA